MRRRWLATTAACIIGLGVMSRAHADDSTRWYVAHFGEETCVPLDDIGMSGGEPKRLYYGSGDLHTPSDFATMIQTMGGHMTRVTQYKGKALPDGTAVYTGKLGSKELIFYFFADEDMCGRFMDAMGSSR
jgi:hypothetical protein